MRIPLIELLERVLALIAAECSLHHAPESAERQEASKHRGGLVAAAHHTIRAFGIAAADAVLFPFRRLHQLLEAVGVAILQQVARLLPSENVVSRRAPWCAIVVAIAHQEFKKQRRHVELP